MEENEKTNIYNYEKKFINELKIKLDKKTN